MNIINPAGASRRLAAFPICLVDMLNINSLRIPWLLCVLLLHPWTAASADGQRNIVLTLPAETVLASLQKVLPVDIPAQSRQLQGEITIEWVDRLSIHNNVISVRATLFGKNLVVTTNLAGQELQLRLGEVRLPVTCDLRTRFDPVKRKLLVSPQFNESAQNQSNGQDALPSLLGALGGREYAVDLDALETINLKVGSRSIPIVMEPVSIAGVDNALVFQMLPRVEPKR
ncbi:MAG: hypothetical protein FWG62_06100 [Proteobacteria bacterium]|nr:hypothetical protein [Pseudomonadota bacterium]